MNKAFLLLIAVFWLFSCIEEPQIFNNDSKIIGSYKLFSVPDINNFGALPPDELFIYKENDRYIISYDSDVVKYFDGRFAPNNGENIMLGVAVDKYFGIHSPTLLGRVVKFNYDKKRPSQYAWFLEFNVNHWEGEVYTLLRIGGYYQKID